jgi:hypothetical protein
MRFEVPSELSEAVTSLGIQISDWKTLFEGAVAVVVGIEVGVVSVVINLESSGVWTPDRRPRHEE